MGFEAIIAIFFNLFFWLIVFLIYTQYKRIYKVEIQMLGEAKRSLRDRTVHAISFGILGGIIGTVLMMTFGVTIDTKDFAFMLPTALFLMLIHVRYLCFSYAGGLLSLSSLILGFPKLNVPSVMAIVAILHLVESILIRFDGHKDAMPVFSENLKYGIVGGFTLQRFWPIPFAVLLFTFAQIEGAREINLPNWWPIFKPSIDALKTKNISLQISAVVAALGYGDVAFIQTPREKSKKASARLFAYSISLLVLTIISVKLIIFQYIAAIFAPLAHEFLILYGQKEEKKAEPIFRQYEKGVTVLDLKEGSIGMAMGLKQGDVILHINNQPVNNKEDIQEILQQRLPYIWVDVIHLNGKHETLEYQDYRQGINNLGIIVVSEDVKAIVDMDVSASIFKYLFKKVNQFRK
jgi:membrane-associated protease RseP (regulator of RpoE activity)